MIYDDIWSLLLITTWSIFSSALPIWLRAKLEFKIYYTAFCLFSYDSGSIVSCCQDISFNSFQILEYHMWSHCSWKRNKASSCTLFFFVYCPRFCLFCRKLVHNVQLLACLSVKCTSFRSPRGFKIMRHAKLRMIEGWLSARVLYIVDVSSCLSVKI